jgi:hypothetical protein
MDVFSIVGIRAIWQLYGMELEERSLEAAVMHSRSMRFAPVVKDFRLGRAVESHKKISRYVVTGESDNDVDGQQ